MPNKTLIRSCGVALVVLGVAMSSSNANAGFQWISQDGAAKNSVTVENRSSVPAVSAPQTIVPVVVNGSTTPSQAQSQYFVQQRVHGPVPGAAPNLGNMAPAAGREEVVQGFASNVPLSLALRQVLPTGLSFLISPEVEIETLVSYRGGRAWRDTLLEMLSPVGLVAQEQGNVITIKSMRQAQAMGRMDTMRPVDRGYVDRGYRDDMHRPLMRGNGSLVLSEPGSMAMNQRAISNEPSWDLQSGPQSSYEYNRDYNRDSRIIMPSEPVGQGSLGVLRMPQRVDDRGAFGMIGMDRMADWSAGKGETLRQVLEKWASRAGFELKWIAEYDYPVEASVRFSGSFESAVRNLLSGFDGATPQPIGSLHNNSGAGQRVLVIQTRGNSYSE